ncbi:SOS response-associated peptidase [Phyllobacterium zundukense]|uniref:SOS response-associated peptidase n=1 Tax=Phyllobacterium zundukense TaxID=1867719 RepID=A0ACD4CX76_9HYPH|nr:SOS response-associated peptidase [Phyllobacterium zundukense]UXN58174.1 SOS response-associated peptidase [Phyllobacterium zundukense]
MCNLYNATTTHEAMRQLFLPINDLTNRLTPQMDVFPDYPAPIGRKDANGDRELAIARWGMPTPPQFLKGEVDYGVTNIRNVKSPHWQAWLGPANRCVVPATSFSEYGKVPDPVTKKKPLYWFALNEDKPLFWFAGIWTSWYSVRKKKEGPVQADIFAFLTTSPNAVVKPIHEQAMPVILRTSEEIDIWMNAPAEEALQLQRPLPDNELIVLPQPKAEEEQPLLL